MVMQLLESFDDGAWDMRLSGLSASRVDEAYGRNGKGAWVGEQAGAGFSVGVSNPCVVGFDFNITAASSNELMLGFGATSYACLHYDSGAALLFFEFFNGAASHRYVYSPPGSVPMNTWHHLDLKIFQSTSSASSIEWSLNGAPITDTRSDGDVLAVYQYLQFGRDHFRWSIGWYIDNLYVLDTTGTVNNDILGPIRVDDLYPNGIGNSSAMTTSDGISYNFEMVDENPPNDDTDYVYSDTAGTLDTYLTNDSAGPSEVIAGVIANVVSKKTDAGAKFVRPVARISSVDYNGDSSALAESYGLATHVWDESPATATTWGSTEIDSMEIGQEVRDS